LPTEAGTVASVRLDSAEEEEFVGLLHQWDQDPEDAWLGTIDPALRLGLYTEQLIGAWLRQSRLIRLLAMNWPLRVNRITLGEADFLVRREGDRTSPLQLWEIACKFYLHVPGRGWLGPGLNDSLASKLQRVRGHQLRLIHEQAFQAAWQGDWSARAWMAGWLLESAELLVPGAAIGTSAESADARWDGAAPRHADRIPSCWAEAGTPSAARAGVHAGSLGVTQWWLLPKRRWLRPAFADEPVAQRFEDLDEAMSFVESSSAPRERGSDRPRPLMLAGIRWLRGFGQEPVAAEAMRLMLVPRGWSERAAAVPAMNGEQEAREGGEAGEPITA